MVTIRYVEKFEAIDASISYSFALGGYECQIEQDMRTAFGYGVGADYAHDFHGYGIPPKGLKRIRLRALSVESSAANLEAEIDEAMSECYRIGLGYLYTLDQDGTTRRRCLARLNSMPSLTRSVGQFVHIPLIFDFVGLSDWMATTPTTFGETGITANSKSFTVTNPGNIPVTSGFYIALTAGDTAGWGPVTIKNITTGQVFTSARVAELDGAYLLVGLPDYSVTYDNGRDSLLVGSAGRYVGQAVVGNQAARNDNGAADFSGGFFTLEPGDNSFVITMPGSPNYDYGYFFYGAYA